MKFAGVSLAGLVLLLSLVLRASGQTAPPPRTYKGLEISIAGLDRASSAALSDCPPGENNQRAVSRPGEGFAIVTVKVKVLPGYQPVPLKRPGLTDHDGKTYSTAASFVDVGKVPEFSCAFPFRIPAGTRVKSIQIDGVSFDLTALDTQAR